MWGAKLSIKNMFSPQQCNVIIHFFLFFPHAHLHFMCDWLALGENVAQILCSKDISDLKDDNQFLSLCLSLSVYLSLLVYLSLSPRFFVPRTFLVREIAISFSSSLLLMFLNLIHDAQCNVLLSPCRFSKSPKYYNIQDPVKPYPDIQ